MFIYYHLDGEVGKPKSRRTKMKGNDFVLLKDKHGYGIMKDGLEQPERFVSPISAVLQAQGLPPSHAIDVVMPRVVLNKFKDGFGFSLDGEAARARFKHADEALHEVHTLIEAEERCVEEPVVVPDPDDPEVDEANDASNLAFGYDEDDNAKED